MWRSSVFQRNTVPHAAKAEELGKLTVLDILKPGVKGCAFAFHTCVQSFAPWDCVLSGSYLWLLKAQWTLLRKADPPEAGLNTARLELLLEFLWVCKIRLPWSKEAGIFVIVMVWTFKILSHFNILIYIIFFFISSSKFTFKSSGWTILTRYIAIQVSEG